MLLENLTKVLLVHNDLVSVIGPGLEARFNK